MIRLSRVAPAVGSALVLALGGAGATALAHTDAHAHQTGTHNSVSAWDEQWLQGSIEGDRFEIAGGRQAQQNTGSQAVKDYGARLVADHTKALKTATKLAKRYGIDIPKAPSQQEQGILELTGGLQGQAFDKAYLDVEAKDHQQDIAEAHDEVKDGQNLSIRRDARHELPTLRKHLELARHLGGKGGRDPLA